MHRTGSRRSPFSVAITRDAKAGENWVSRETRQTFVSIMIDNDAPLETIAGPRRAQGNVSG
jgi:hypothetical protein